MVFKVLGDVRCTSETRCRFVSFISVALPVVDEQSQFGCCQPNRPEPCGEFAVIPHRYLRRAVVLYPLAHSLQRELARSLWDTLRRTWSWICFPELHHFCLLHLRIHLPLRVHFRAHCVDAISAYEIVLFVPGGWIRLPITHI